jgi:two-component system sensor histidine kinase BarA
MSSKPAALLVYDWNLAIGIAGGNPEIAAELLSLFLQELPSQTAAMRKAVRSGNLEKLRQLTHKLHGSASYCGTPALKEAAQNLESVLIERQTESIPTVYAQLLEEIQRLLQYHRADA